MSKRILLAEDDMVNQIVVEHLLQEAGYEVVIAETGLEALAAAAQQSFEYILMDIEMPEMNGLEATRALRERGNKTPIIGLTGYFLAEEIALQKAAGMDAHIAKPFDMEKFTAVQAQL